MTENVKYNFIMAFQNFLSLEGGGNFYHLLLLRGSEWW